MGSNLERIRIFMFLSSRPRASCSEVLSQNGYGTDVRHITVPQSRKLNIEDSRLEDVACKEA